MGSGAISAEDLATLRRCASAALAARERLELMGQRADDGSPPPPGRADAALAPLQELTDLLVRLTRDDPGLRAVRFRGHLISLVVHDGRVLALSVLPERLVVDVEG